MQKAGQDTPSSVVIPDEETRILRAKLILEEALETLTALGVTATVTDSDGKLGRSTKLSFAVTGEADLEEIVDGCADISVVTIGTLVAFGVDDESILEEVDKANLRKFAEGSYRREDGKWMKPPGWTKPDILGVVERQGMVKSDQ
jgi:predicted HAD superfamily Cof-like phosphohydrolase